MVAVMDESLSQADSERVVEDTVRRAGTSFYQGMRILSPPRRMAMWAVYAFCRVVDDIADEPAPQLQKQAQLNEWRQRIERLYQGQAEEAITTVLLPAIRDYHLRREDFLAIIEGMEKDAFTEVVAPTWNELDHYCDCVASAVGRLSVRAFGDSSARADDVAWSLGRALQFTNILRDLAEDAARGRLYLPAEWLADAGIAVTTPGAMLRHAAMPNLCRRMAQQAQQYFTAAEAAIADCDAKALRPAALMAASYQAVLKKLERRGWDKLDQPVKVSKLYKLWLVVKYGLK